ncbi:ABC transporter ATP-binding protein [Nibrella saemangeumensis]|uniref:ABC transporter ATP-binding protein n=1 Tax=Nibrella saemangeumensis TaxID=1084526 RepID=A0ABP8N218_9BACT
MSNIVIQVEEVSKLYRLGTIGTGSLRQDVQGWWNTKVRKKDSPFFKSGGMPADAPDQSSIWALKQVSFDVRQGDVWGIIGHNGSGKSTLLKIISRIIRPTQGVVRGKGKVSSLLEVGAGFHQELTGRENMYLSGYILGMSRREINQRFDEIVTFSGIEPFIDTPVKRYSSGMYVRLAFAIAVHLDADIMIADEVLAVGDAEFQKKCMVKMQEFSHQEGRTILFVSHDIQAVSRLCHHALWLDHGAVKAIGPIQDVVSQYIGSPQLNYHHQAWTRPDEAPGNESVRLKSCYLIPDVVDPAVPIDIRTPLTFTFQLWALQGSLRLVVGLRLFNYNEECVLEVMSPHGDYQQGILQGEFHIPGHFLNNASYYISLTIYQENWAPLFSQRACVCFTVEDYRDQAKVFPEKWLGTVRPDFPVKLVQLAKNKLMI